MRLNDGVSQLGLRIRDLQSSLFERMTPRQHGALSLLLMKRVSYSQLGEDIWVYQNYFNQPVPDAVLVEIGAYSGIKYSNTLLLERLTGSAATLVEPVDQSFRQCKVNRPRSRVYRVAVAETFGLMKFVGVSAVAGLRDYMSSEYVDQWGLTDADVQDVVTIPLWALIRIEGLAFIDFLSIDVQGSEMAVLCGADWTIPIGCICIELEGQDAERDQTCRQILQDHGFVFRVRLGISEIWTNPGYFRRDSLFRSRNRRFRNGFLTPYLEKSWRTQVLQLVDMCGDLRDSRVATTDSGPLPSPSSNRDS